MAKNKKYLDTSARTLNAYDGSSNFVRLFNHYTNIALNLYEWEGLPKGIESRFVEKALFDKGQAFFGIDDMLGYICLPCSSQSSFNVYGEPLNVLVTGYGYTKTFDINDGIKIHNNAMEMPTLTQIHHYCRKIDEIEYAIQTNLDFQNSPYVFACDKSTEFTFKQVMNKIKNKEDAIFLDKNLMRDGQIGVNVIELKKEYIVDKLRTEKEELERELLTILGLNCVINKESGMNTTELNSNNMLIEINQEVGFLPRKKACDEINKKFGLNLSVKIKLDELKLDMTGSENEEGDDNNGNI